jgi:hypothetical protein
MQPQLQAAWHLQQVVLLLRLLQQYRQCQLQLQEHQRLGHQRQYQWHQYQLLVQQVLMLVLLLLVLLVVLQYCQHQQHLRFLLGLVLQPAGR